MKNNVIFVETSIPKYMIVQASAALSADGYTDDTSAGRLVLSHPADWQEVYRLRAGCDAVMVGAETVRRDDPSLLLKDPSLRHRRVSLGMSPDPVKVTVTRSGDLDSESRFFSTGAGDKVVIAAGDAPGEKLERLGRVATVVRVGVPVTAEEIVGVLETMGIRSLFLEGGSRLMTLFLTWNRVDLLRIAVAPFFVGESGAPRFVRAGAFPFGKDRRMEVLQVRQVGDMSVTDYSLSRRGTDYFRLRQAVALAFDCPRSDSAYSVGAVAVTAAGQVFTGYSRETAADNHAEEEAILKAEKAGVSLKGGVMYSSMEPCSTRKSKPLSCSALITAHKMARVVFAVHEPDHFVQCRGAAVLEEAGIEVSVIGDLAAEAMLANAHIRL